MAHGYNLYKDFSPIFDKWQTLLKDFSTRINYFDSSIW